MKIDKITKNKYSIRVRNDEDHFLDLKKFWRAVLKQALIDATPKYNVTLRTERAVAQKEALEWLKTDDFHIVAMLAGVPINKILTGNIHETKKSVREAYESGIDIIHRKNKKKDF